MRFALISLEEPANGADGSVRVAGRAIYRWQAAMALACGCERILCWAPRDVAAPLALQKEVEGRGSRFQPIGDLHRLARVIGPGDELLVFSPGLMIDEEDLRRFVDGGHAIATIPADEGSASGFDRIDLTRLAAGLMFVPGALVSRLADLPDDCEPGGSLLRIALQSGVPTRAVGQGAGQTYRVVKSEHDASAIETAWFERDWAKTAGPPRRLSRKLTDWIGRRTAHKPRAAGTALGAFALGSILAPALAATGFVTAGLGVLALTGLAGEAFRRLSAVGSGVSRKGKAHRFARWPGALVDILLVALLTMGLEGWGEAPADRIFLALAAVMGLRLATRGWGAALTDRLISAFLFAIAGVLGVLVPVLQMVVLAALAFALHFGTRSDN